jgi:hypothetical protein
VKKLHIFTVLLLLALLISPALGQRHMVHTYWHQLDGPYWIYKPGEISIAQDYIYSYGSDKNQTSTVFRSTDSGAFWESFDRSNWPANSISASHEYPQDAYYTSPGIDVFSTTNAGTDWTGSQAPPGNLNFNVCAANQFDQQKAVVGCDRDGVNSVLWKTEDHGDTWLSVGGLPDYAVNDIKWHPDDGLPNDYFVAMKGSPNNCFYEYIDQTGTFENRSPDEINQHMDEVVCFDVDKTDQTRFVIAGYDSGNWVLAWCSAPSFAWHYADAIHLPPEFGSENVILDISIYGNNSGFPVFYMATDIGVFKNNVESNWERVYDNPGDNKVLSVVAVSATEFYAGTLHRFLKVTENNNIWTANPINDVMFRADLKSAWTSGSGSDVCYSLNKKTGAIFELDLDFSDFTPQSAQITFDEDDIVANISGSGGEFDGLAVAGYKDINTGDIVIASSKDDQGNGKVIRLYDGQWEEIDVEGDPAFEALAINGNFSCGAFGGTQYNYYIGDATGDNWDYPGAGFQTEKVNDLLIFNNGVQDYVVMSGKYGTSGDVRIAVSDFLGGDWQPKESGLPTEVNEVYRVVEIHGTFDHAFYAATDNGVYKTADLIDINNNPWVLMDNQLPSGVFTDIVPGPQNYTINPPPEQYQYKRDYAVYSVMTDVGGDRFFVSGDAARSWVEDSSFPMGSEARISRLQNYSDGSQFGIISASADGLLYHPHNVINGMYSGNILGGTLDFYWGPGLILVNGTVFVTPVDTEDPDNPFMNARLNINPGTRVLFDYDFNLWLGIPSGLEIDGHLEAHGTPTNKIYFSSSRTNGIPGDWTRIYSKFHKHPDFNEYIFPETNLSYCEIEYAEIGLWGESCLSLSLDHSEVMKCERKGVAAINHLDIGPENDMFFLINVSNSVLHDNPEDDIYIDAYGEFYGCDFVPWDGKGDPPGPIDIPDPEKPPHSGGIPCEYQYFSLALVNGNELYNSQKGAFIGGFLDAFVEDNTIHDISDYGIQCQTIYGTVKKNQIESETEYSGIDLEWPLYVFTERNIVTGSMNSGLSIEGN